MRKFSTLLLAGFFMMAWGSEVMGQETVTFVVDTGYYQSVSEGGEGGAAGRFSDLGGTGLGMFASWESGFTVNYRELKTEGDDTGDSRLLQVGDQLTLVMDATTVRGETGFALVTGVPGTINFDNRRNNSRLSVRQTGVGNQYFLSDLTSGPANFNFNTSIDRRDYTFEITKTSQNTVNVQLNVDGLDYNNYDIVLGGSEDLNISHVSIWLRDDWNGSTRQDVIAKDMEITNIGNLQLGFGLTGTDSFTPGLISDGLDANSASTVSSNSVVIGGTSGTSVIFDQAHTYTGSTTINEDATLVLEEDLLSSLVTITDGGTLRVTGTETNSITVEDGGTLEIAEGATLTIRENETLTIKPGGELRNEGRIIGNVVFEDYITGQEGWRFLSSPFSGLSYDDVIGDFWTQGFIGANYEGEDAVEPALSNVRILTLDNLIEGSQTSNSYVSINNITDGIPAGRGFAMNIYAFDEYTGDGQGTGDFPKSFEIDGAEPDADVSLSGGDLNQGENHASLIGNPFLASIRFSDIYDHASTDNIFGTVYVYSHSGDTFDETFEGVSGGFKTWSVADPSAGALENGRIGPFQGFLVVAEDRKSVV